MGHVHRIDDVALGELVGVAHVDDDGTVPVHQVDQFLGCHGAPAAHHLVAHEEREGEQEGAHQERVVADEFEELFHPCLNAPPGRRAWAL